MGKKLIKDSEVKIRELAQFIGVLVSSLPAVMYGALFYRFLEINKLCGLRINFGNFEKVTNLTDMSKAGISWWLGNVHSSPETIMVKNPDFIIEVIH